MDEAHLTALNVVNTWYEATTSAHLGERAGRTLVLAIAAALRQARAGALEDAAKVAADEPTWVTADSYRAQVDLRTRIAAAIRALKEAQS